MALGWNCVTACWKKVKMNNCTKIMRLAPSVINCTKVVVAITDIQKFQSTKSLNVVFTIHCAYNMHCYLTENCTKQNK